MPDEWILAGALALTAVFGVYFYKYQKNRKTGKQRFLEKAKAAGCCAAGAYEDAKLYLGVENSSNAHFRNDTMRVTYRYTVDGTVYHKTMHFQSPGRNSVDYPSSVLVYYDPRNPRRAVCPEEATPAHQRRSGCLICAGGIFLFLFFSFHLLRFLAGIFL